MGSDLLRRWTCDRKDCSEFIVRPFHAPLHLPDSPIEAGHHRP